MLRLSPRPHKIASSVAVRALGLLEGNDFDNIMFHGDRLGTSITQLGCVQPLVRATAPAWGYRRRELASQTIVVFGTPGASAMAVGGPTKSASTIRGRGYENGGLIVATSYQSYARGGSHIHSASHGSLLQTTRLSVGGPGGFPSLFA